MQIVDIKGDLNLPEEVFDRSKRPSFHSLQKTYLLLFLTGLDRPSQNKHRNMRKDLKWSVE